MLGLVLCLPGLVFSISSFAMGNIVNMIVGYVIFFVGYVLLLETTLKP